MTEQEAEVMHHPNVSANAGLKASILGYFDAADSAKSVCLRELSEHISLLLYGATIQPQISSSFPAAPVEALLHGEI